MQDFVLKKTMKRKRLANEILDAINGAGGAARSVTIQKWREANRAFAHYRW